MKNKLTILIIIFSFWGNPIFTQNRDIIFERIGAISNNGFDFYNIDGIEITSQLINAPFNKKNIAKKYKKFNIKESQLIVIDSSYKTENFYVLKTDVLTDSITSYTSYYFINTYEGIRGITFGSFNKNDKQFENKFVTLILSKSIPSMLFENVAVDSINFAGRKIKLGRACQWMGVNNMQCPYHGQMNWSVHKNFDDAKASVNNQLSILKSKKQGKIIKDEIVAIIFEGVETTARKIVYDFKGITSLMASISGGKTLSIYYVALPLRNNFVSCVLSHWNNDVFEPAGLPALLNEVMQIKN